MFQKGISLFLFLFINLFLINYLYFHISVTPVSKKNISRNTLGDKIGRVHLKKQNLDQMGGRRVNALRDH